MLLGLQSKELYQLLCAGAKFNQGHAILSNFACSLVSHFIIFYTFETINVRMDCCFFALQEHYL
jgi:hypothetical protein